MIFMAVQFIQNMRLRSAVRKGDMERAEEALERGADPTCRGVFTRRTAIQEAETSDSLTKRQGMLFVLKVYEGKKANR